MEGSLKDYQEQFHTGKILGGHVMSMLDPKHGMRVLDLGCGDGHLTKQIAEAGAEVVGVDADAAFVASAASIGVNAMVMDGHELTFKQEFDRVFSNAALHWLSKDPAAVARGIYEALCGGGKFVAEFGGYGNVSTIVTALTAELEKRGYDLNGRNPWFFPSSDEYTSILLSAGFIIEECKLVPAITPVPEGKDISGWLRTFCSKWLFDIDESDVASILECVRENLSKTSLHNDGKWFIDYVRLRVVAQKPAMQTPAEIGTGESTTKRCRVK